ncbi:MAG: hypothetical protein ABIT36_07620 [Steroidobacteraceae bacterium]
MRNVFRGRTLSQCAILLLTMLPVAPAAAESVSGSQRRAAEEMLGAIASGNANVVALAIHPTELELLRKRVIDLMRTEADRDENGIRTRLFGPAMPLNDIERLTPANFYAIVSRRLTLTGRDYDSVNWLEAVKDSGELVHVIGRGKPQRDRGNVSVVVLVSLVPWGKDWKAAIPLEVQAQIDDLIAARSPNGTIGAAPPLLAATADDANPGNMQPIVQLLKDAEAALTASKCDEYYSRFMSPNFRRLTASKAQKSLVVACSNKPEVREVLIAALRAARESKPRYDYDATRAIYDLKGKGLPFERFVLEQVDKKWYVAE